MEQCHASPNRLGAQGSNRPHKQLDRVRLADIELYDSRSDIIILAVGIDDAKQSAARSERDYFPCDLSLLPASHQ
jgi:hypothetical protein